MARVKTQYMIMNIMVNECQFDRKRRLIFREEWMNDTGRGLRSAKLMISECRILRDHCHTKEEKSMIVRDEFNRIVRDEEGAPVTIDFDVMSGQEFLVLNFKGCKKKKMHVKSALRDGITFIRLDGTEIVYRRAVRSASQVRQSKALYTYLDVHTVRNLSAYDPQFAEEEVISKIESRFGLVTSSSHRIERPMSFDVLPDYKIYREHEVETYDPKVDELKLQELNDFFTPHDGQGTILPSAAVDTAFELEIISKKERRRLQMFLRVQKDPRKLIKRSRRFASMWRKIPKAYLIRFGFAKGLLVVHPHNLERTDCDGNKSRTEGKVMKMWGEKEHRYNFKADIMFTDSMWKENISKHRLGDVRLEVVLWSKPRANGLIYMGYQYWQALEGVDPVEFARERINELKDTIFSNADDAKAFLGLLDSTQDPDAYEERMRQAGSKIQKVLEILQENPDMIRETWIQRSLREMRHTYIEKMGQGRIPVEGANPFIITAPECLFGRKSKLQQGQSYFNGVADEWAIFRSPLIHRSEASVIETVDVRDYHDLYDDLLVFSPYDDYLPRAGGADTDGDKMAMTNNPQIVAGVQRDLPMLFDKGGSGDKSVINDDAIYAFDYATIMSDAPTIGEATNLTTTWKDLLFNMDNPDVESYLQNINECMIERLVKIGRFMQGWAIDYAKTGYFPNYPAEILTKLSPNWKPWSRQAQESEIPGALVYNSRSRLGVLKRSIDKYLEQKYNNRNDIPASNDFTFEFAERADLEEVERIKPIVATLERSYRKELEYIHKLELEEKDTREQVSLMIDKYQRAMLSIDADIATIAACAYQHSYYENGSKGKAISFPWVVCYEGLLLNASASSDTKTKLRTARFSGHIDDVPHTLKFYQCKSGDRREDGYSVFCKVPNGTYETYRKNGNLFVKMKARTNKRVKQIEELVPENKFFAFDVKGFKANGYSAEDMVNLLHDHNNRITVKRVNDEDEVRAAVFIGGERIASVGKEFKTMLIPYLPAVFEVRNADQLRPTYFAKRAGKHVESSFFALDCLFIKTLQKKDKAVREAEHEDPQTSGFDTTPMFVEYLPEIMERINTSADYWAHDVQPDALRIVAASVRQTGAVQVGQLCAEVHITDVLGRSLTVPIRAEEGKRFEVATDRTLKADVRAFILQLAHYELCRMFMERQAN